MDDLRKVQGRRLKEVRKILGKTQESFTQWLTDHGLTGNYNEPYKAKTVAAWESGRRAIPDDIKMVLSQNVTVDGYPVQYAYLNGDTDFITQSMGAIVKRTFEILNPPQPVEWKMATAEDIHDLANDPRNRFALILLNDLLPIFNHEKNDFWDIMRFNNVMYDEIGKLIEQYLQEERQGK